MEISIMAINAGPKIIEDGLVLCLDAANKRSYPGAGTTWTDLTANKNNGTLTNGPTFDSANGGSILLDGSNDAIRISDLTFSSAGFTYSFIAKFSSSQSQNFPRIIAGGIEIEWINGTHQLRWRWVGGNPSFLDSNSNYFIQDAIHVYTITYTSPNLTLYRDGSLFQTMTYTSSSDTAFNTFMNRSSYNRPLGANVYQYLLYNKALTSAEVLQNYNVIKGRFE
jgi:hypothetical protein